MAKINKRKVSNCRQVSQGINCLGKYSLSYDGNAPIFICDVCGDRETTWKKFYDEYLQLYKTKDNWEETKNHITCLIGMFCHMYKEYYTTDYTFVPKNPNPYSSKECKDAWQLLAAFNRDVHEARRYIIWVFRKAINKTTSITNFGYLNAPGLIRKYKLYSVKKNVFNRATKLPQEFVEWCNSNVADVIKNYAMETMNDLGAFLSYAKHYELDVKDDSAEKKIILMAEKHGLIKDGKLNIGDTK